MSEASASASSVPEWTDSDPFGLHQVHPNLSADSTIVCCVSWDESAAGPFAVSVSLVPPLAASGFVRIIGNGSIASDVSNNRATV